MEILSSLSLVMGLAMALWNIHKAYSTSLKKGYAAERDFAELRAQFNSLSNDMADLKAMMRYQQGDRD